MKRSKKLYYSVCSLLPTGILKKIAPADIILPYHHLVSDEDVLHIKHLYPYKNTRQFGADLDALLKHFRAVSVQEVVESVKTGRKMPKNAALLSFDDGFRQVYDTIAPMLASKGVPGAFFVNPAFLDNRVLFYRCKISLVIEALMSRKGGESLWKECVRVMEDGGVDDRGGMKDVGEEAPGKFEGFDGLIRRIKNINNLNQGLLDRLAVLLELSFDDYLRSYRPFLSSAQAWDLHVQGFTIGAHSWDHPYYGLIPGEEQRRQTVESMAYVKEKFAPSHSLFSFPHSDAGLGQGFFDRLVTEGVPIDVFFGIQNQKKELNNRVLHRFNAERPDLPLSRQINGVLLWMLWQKWSGRDRIVRC
jgi:peptidoglycan/xylan/chitin deacetylase (PgdA/CDA1 family)